jgi:hypothetical protein
MPKQGLQCLSTVRVNYSCAYLVDYIRMNLGSSECVKIHRKALVFVLALIHTSDHTGILAVYKYVQYLVVSPQGQDCQSSTQSKKLLCDSIPTACGSNKELQQYGHVINWA